MNTTSCSATTSRFGFFEKVFSSLSLCRLHCQQCSHCARRSVRLTSLLARSRAGRCACTQNMRVRTACTRASCAAKAGMEQVIAASSRLLQPPSRCHHERARNHSRFRHHHHHLLLCPHLPPFQLHHLLLCPHLPPFQLQRSPRSCRCSCLASVAKAKERAQIMVLPLPHQPWLHLPISLLPFSSPAALQTPKLMCCGAPSH